MGSPTFEIMRYSVMAALLGLVFLTLIYAVRTLRGAWVDHRRPFWVGFRHDDDPACLAILIVVAASSFFSVAAAPPSLLDQH